MYPTDQEKDWGAWALHADLPLNQTSENGDVLIACEWLFFFLLAIHFPDMVAGICKQTGSEVHSGLRHDVYYWQSLFFASWQCDSSSLHSQKIY